MHRSVAVLAVAVLAVAVLLAACGDVTVDGDAVPDRDVATAAAGPGTDDAAGDGGGSGDGPDDTADDGAVDDAPGDAAGDVDPAGDADANRAADETTPRLTIVATVSPLADLVAAVGGTRIEVTPMVPPGVDSHTYEPRPSDVARLASADAYLGLGLGLNDAALRLAEEHLGDRAPVVRLGEIGLDADDLLMDHGHTHADDGHTHDDGGHTHDDGGHTHADDGHTHADDPGPNPHVWTSLRNASALVDAIAETLGELDPDGADHHAANATAYQQRLATLDRLIGEATATIPVRNRTLITYHDAWAYFARDHGLDAVTAVQPADYSEPSAAEVRAVIDLIRERGVTAVFGAQEFPERVLTAIADETDATYVGELADDVLPGAPGSPEHTYLELMRRNAITIVDALGGDATQLSAFDAS